MSAKTAPQGKGSGPSPLFRFWRDYIPAGVRAAFLKPLPPALQNAAGTLAMLAPVWFG